MSTSTKQPIVRSSAREQSDESRLSTLEFMPPDDSERPTPPFFPTVRRSVSSGSAIHAGGQTADPYIGCILSDRYRVIRNIGSGGMGAVYLAEHVVIERKVALKILFAGARTRPDVLLRFKQEARAASRCGHANIIDILDFGETPDGSPFIVMEYLEGRDLASVIQGHGALPLPRIRSILTQVCRGLGAAHAKGIIHRDIKPENIFIVDREETPVFVKILDFGIARVRMPDDPAGASRLTQDGHIFGTPAYMSPEQVRGEPVDHRADIYALGCVLYEMLTGDVPHRAPAIHAILAMQQFAVPERPSRRAPDRGIPVAVDEVVQKCLAKERRARFQSMKELATALWTATGGDPREAWGSEPAFVTAPIEIAPPANDSDSRSLGNADTMEAARLVPAQPDMPNHLVPVNSGPHMETAILAPPPARDVTPGRRPWKWLLPVVLVAGGGALAGLGVIAHPGTIAAPQSRPENPPARAVAPLPSPPAAVVIHLATTPPGAAVERDHSMLGETPLDVTLPRGTEPVEISLKKAGFQTAPLAVLPDQPRTYTVTLIPEPSPPREKIAPARGGHPSGHRRHRDLLVPPI